MAEEMIFRRTARGFDREEVTNYIAKLKEDSQKERKALETKVEELTAQLDDAAKVSETRDAAFLKLRKELENAKAEIERQKSAGASAAGLSEEVERLRGEAAKASAELAAKVKEADSLRRELSEIRENGSGAREELENALAAEESARKELERVRAESAEEVAELRSKLTESADENARLLAELSAAAAKSAQKPGKAESADDVGRAIIDVRRYADMLLSDTTGKIASAADESEEAVALTVERLKDISKRLKGMKAGMADAFALLIKENEDLTASLNEFASEVAVPFNTARRNFIESEKRDALIDLSLDGEGEDGAED